MINKKIVETAKPFITIRFHGSDVLILHSEAPTVVEAHPVVVKGFCSEVRISYLGREIARHKRIWEREQVSFEPLHYLALLERKPGAIDYARPLEEWKLPVCFGILRRRMENERQGNGTREYIRVLRLLEKHPMGKLSKAVDDGLQAGALTCDAIAQFLYPKTDWRETLFILDDHPHLRHVQVAMPDVSVYQTLLAAGGAR